MNLNLMNPKFIAPAVEVAVLIIFAVALFAQKRRKITTLLNDRFRAVYDLTFYQQAAKSKAEAKLAEHQFRAEML